MIASTTTQVVFVTAGAACLIAAVAGVGIKALNVEIGAIQSARRQVLLGVLGGAFILVGFLASGGDGDASPKALPSLTDSGSSIITPSVTASSTLRPVPGNSYRAQNLVDDDNTTAWCEGTTGAGIGESVTFTFPAAVRLNRIDVINGYNKGGENRRDLFRKNARAENVDVGWSNGSELATLQDTRGVQHLPVPKSATTFVKLTIKSVYPGTKYEDLCLTDIQFVGASGS